MRSAHAVIAHTLVILCNFSEKIFAKHVMQCQCVHQRRCVCIPHKNEIIMHCVSCWLASLQMHTVHLHSWLQSWKMMSEEAQWMLIMTRLLLDLVDHSLMSMWYARHLQVLAAAGARYDDTNGYVYTKSLLFLSDHSYTCTPLFAVSR